MKQLSLHDLSSVAGGCDGGTLTIYGAHVFSRTRKVSIHEIINYGEIVMTREARLSICVFNNYGILELR